MDPNMGVKGSVETVDIGGVTVGAEPVVCASVAAAEPEDMLERATSVEADVAELRVDTLDDPRDPELERLLASVDFETPLLLTVRREAEEGEYRGGETSRIALVTDLMEHVDAVDIELEAAEESRRRVRKKARELNIPVIASFHDHSETSSKEELVNVMERGLEEGGIAKVAVTPHSRRDVLTLLDATLEARETLGGPVAAIAMGEVGGHSRLVAPVYGSSITYAAADRAVAAGQLSVEQTMDGLRLMGLRE